MNKKALVIIPGFRGSADETQFVSMAEKSKVHNIETFILNWPYWNIDMSRYSMSATLEAVNRKVAELKVKGYEVVIAAESLGGVIATIIASKVQLAGLILIVTPYKFISGDDMEERRAKWEELGYQEYLSKSKGIITRVPYSFVEDALKYDAREYIDRVSAPTSFLVGLCDKSVPNQLTRTLFDKATVQKEWVEFEGMEHTYRYQPDKMEQVVEKVVEITNKFLSTNDV